MRSLFLVLLAFMSVFYSCQPDKPPINGLKSSARVLQLSDTACAIEITITELQNLPDNDKQVGMVYKITDAAIGQNTDSFPVFMVCKPCPIYFNHCQGYMQIPNAFALNPVTFDPLFNFISEFRDINRNIVARGHNFISGSLSDPVNCIQSAIKLTALCWAGTIPQWENIEWNDASVYIPTDLSDVQFPNISMEASSVLILGDSGQPSYGNIPNFYYGTLQKHSRTKIGNGSIIVYLNVGMHANVEFGKWNYMGADQGLGIGSYYSNFGMHSQVWTGDSVNLDSCYIDIGVAGVMKIGNYSHIKKRNITIGNQSQFSVKDSAIVEGNVVIGDCASLIQRGKNFRIIKSLFIRSGVYITDSTDNADWGGVIDVTYSTMQLTLNCVNDTTPDGKSIKWSNPTLTCSGSSLDIYEIQNLRPNCYYEITGASGKTFTFKQGSFFKMSGGQHFTLYGSNNDKLIIKTNYNASAAYEISAINY